MDDIKIISTMPGDENFHLFEKLPIEIYPSDSLRFKLPDSINIEFLEACYVLTFNGKALARAALYNNPHLKYKMKKSFCIGNYESINDKIISSQLLNFICFEAKKIGAEYIIGPMNGSTWDNYRFSQHHNFPNFFLEPYHHLYYNDHFLNSGLEIISNYYSSIDNSFIFNQPEVLKREKEFEQLGVTFRNINLADFENELIKLYKFNSLVFKSNFLYTPISEATFINKYKATKNVLNPDFVIIAEDETNNIIGYFLFFTDFFNTNEKSLIAKTGARHPDKKWTGLGHVIGNLIYRKAAEQGYKSSIHAFILEVGTSTALSKNFAGNIYKNYALYGKSI